MEDAVLDISKVKFLTTQVKLSEIEARYILLRCRFVALTDLNRIFEEAVTNSKSEKEVYASLLGTSESEIKKILRAD